MLSAPPLTEEDHEKLARGDYVCHSSTSQGVFYGWVRVAVPASNACPKSLAAAWRQYRWHAEWCPGLDESKVLGREHNRFHVRIGVAPVKIFLSNADRRLPRRLAKLGRYNYSLFESVSEATLEKGDKAYTCHWEIPREQAQHGLLETGYIRFEPHPTRADLVLVSYANAARGAFGALLGPFHRVTSAVDIAMEEYFRDTVASFLDFFFRKLSKERRDQLVSQLPRFVRHPERDARARGLAPLQHVGKLVRASPFWQVCLGL